MYDKLYTHLDNFLYESADCTRCFSWINYLFLLPSLLYKGMQLKSRKLMRFHALISLIGNQVLTDRG